MFKVLCLALAACFLFNACSEESKVAKEGEMLPELTATDHTGKTVKFSDYKGKQGLVIFFIPKAFTPGCTTETCGFRDNFEKYKEKGYAIFGASRDDQKTLADFVAKYNVPYTYLSDPKGELATSLGITPGKRETIVVGKDGKVEKIVKNVKAQTTFDDLLKDLKS